MFFPPYRREFGGKKHQEASFDTLLVQTEITLMSVATVNYTHEQSIHVNYVIKSFWSKLNENIMLYRQYPNQLKCLNTDVS
jgi:hypothetical protein